MEMVAEVVVEMDLLNILYDNLNLNSINCKNLDNSGWVTAPEAAEDWRFACWVMDH